ncbi:MAG: YifB family Mg chelatase-like AAA ATPase [Nitrospinae bacterium]|nr:YifB family Mg chelatase-like AAA ATPase [Nitrospinota bacterium]
MISKIFSAYHLGIEAFTAEVEVDLTPGTFHYVTVGLPDAAVKESQNRILAAMKNSGFEPPIKKVTVNLAPADVKKEGSAFDLPIALAMLSAQGIIKKEKLKNIFVIGELALDGRVKPVKGILSAAICAKKHKGSVFLVPADNAGEAAVVDGVSAIPVENLAQAVGWLNGEVSIARAQAPSPLVEIASEDEPDFSEVKGQHHVKRAVEVAAAGGHNILMVGPPGSGKSMIASRLATILPGWTMDEAIETSRIHSIAGLLSKERPLLSKRPFRFPHHTVSDAGLVGGGHNPVMPGEASLAHYGVLFLDELPEFRRSALEVLRQPLEDGKVVIARANSTVAFPARFMLVCAMNPCPCGYSTDPTKECKCSAQEVRKYKRKISGPLLDRMDIQVEVPAVKFSEIRSGVADGESSAVIKGRVESARERQSARFAKTRIYRNAEMGNSHLKTFCKIGPESERLMKLAMERLGLSARAWTRTLKVARTIADLAGVDAIATEHVAEAIQYRAMDRQL